MVISARIFTLLKKIGFDWFILGLLGMILLAYVWPDGGTQQGFFSVNRIANIGVSFIFFFYGLKLQPSELKAGLNNWRLHGVVQVSTFLLFPLLVLAFKMIFDPSGNSMLWLGAFYLACLPSTVSSSVVMVSIAKGNIPGAIFNASFSSLAGVFITPLWMGLFLNTAGHNFQLWGVVGKLVIQVILPIAGGIILHSRFEKQALKYRKHMRYFDQIVILLIVYSSFCESFAKNMFQGIDPVRLSILAISMVGLFYAVFFLITLTTKILHFNREDRIAAIFCGSKKSLVHGTVMSKVLFVGSTGVGVILLPIMVYHALQLVSASIIAQSWAGKNE